MLVDVHCHLHFPEFDQDRDAVVERAQKAGVVAIVNSGTEHASNVQVLELAKKYDVAKASLGLYPAYIEKISEEEFQRDLDFIKKNKNNIISIGEVGLDYHHTTDTQLQKVQRERFHIILDELKKIKKPFVLHTRKAESDVINIMQSTNLKKVDFHCFTGSFKLAKKIIDAGWSFSIPPIILRSTQFQGLVDLAPLPQLLTETDAPYLGPSPRERNEPSFVANTVKKIAEIKKIDSDECKKIIFMNYQRLFCSE